MSPNLEISKKIQFKSNGVWKEQPHLDFLYNLCYKKQMWFDYHIKRAQQEGSVTVRGYIFRVKR